MNKLKKPIFKILLFLITPILNLFALELNKIATVDFKENQNLLKSSVKGGNLKIRADGAFIYDSSGHPYPWTVVVKPDKSHFILNQNSGNVIYTTNILSTTNINKINYDIVEITTTGTSVSINLNIVLATLSNSGYLSLETIGSGTSSQIFKITTATNQPQKLLISTKDNTKTAFILKKHSSNGESIDELNLQDIRGFTSNLNNSNFDSIIVNKIVVFCQITDTNLIFYRLTDSDLLSSPNRITLGSSQNGSLSATVNNPEQAFLNIQSSTNLIDWNTFKTIQTEPSLEIVVPANKPKEFIRAIE